MKELLQKHLERLRKDLALHTTKNGVAQIFTEYYPVVAAQISLLLTIMEEAENRYKKPLILDIENDWKMGFLTKKEYLAKLEHVNKTPAQY